ncbi:MAG: hypothetical protein JNM51_04255 [Bacteroidia bacterium]|nr:hypothetical protein [Bacteroidia bacterium]
MKNTIETFILENINYTQLMLHDMDENRFNAYTSYHQTSVQSIHSYLMNFIHQLNDNGSLNETYLKNICQFLDIKDIDNIDTLICVLERKRVQSDGLTPLSLNELQNMVQCIKFITKDNSIDINRISSISELTNTIRKMKQYEMA